MMRRRTAQEVYDTSVGHLIRQGKPASEDGIACSYRTKDGLKCGVGCLITDKEYRVSMEGTNVYDIERCGNLPKILVPFIDLLDELQSLHDDVLMESKVIDKEFMLVAKDIAELYGLSTWILSKKD